MNHNMNGDNSQNIITEDQEINNPFDVTQREIDQMENFVEDYYPFPNMPDPMPNNGIGLGLNLGLGHEPEQHQQHQQQQQLDDQDNQMGGIEFAEPILDNPAYYPGERGISPRKARAMDLIMTVSLASDLYDAEIIDQAAGAMRELLKLASQKQLRPFGDQRSNVSEDSELEQPSFAFYAPNTIPVACGQPAHYAQVPLQAELSREIAVIGINRIGVVEFLMDPSLLTTQFPDIVASASVIREIIEGTVDYDGTIQAMRIEYHMPSPLASTRKGYILRHSKKVSDDTWAVVDLSLDRLFGDAGVTYRRNWSGCTILELPNACTKVTWLENVEVNNSKHHSMLQGMVGFAFGAKRWISAFARQWEWMKCPALRCDYQGNSATPKGAKDVLFLAEKMVQNFFANASSSPDKNSWLPIRVAEDIRVAVKPYFGNVEAAGGGRSTMVIATTTPVPVYQKDLFKFLADPQSRSKWDVITMSNNVREKLRIKIGDERDTGSVVSVLQFETKDGEATITYLQRSYSDSTCSFTIFTPIDIPTMQRLLSGAGDPGKVEFLPSGFVVFPDSPSMNGEDINGGSLLTVVFQIMNMTPENLELSSKNAATVGNLMEETVSLIKDSVIRGNHRRREEAPVE